MKKDKAPVKLKERVLKNGNVSLFLDTYREGKHLYEFLHLYIVPERTPIDKERNKVTRLQAEAHRAKRIIELQNGIYGRVADSEFSKMTLCTAIDNKSNSVSGRTRHSYKEVKNYVLSFGDVTIQKVTKHYILKFLDYLKTCKSRCKKYDPKPLKDSTISLIYGSLNAVLNKAVRDGIIQNNPCNKIDVSEKPKRGNDKMCYLTSDELKQMAQTKTQHIAIKRAFIFACYTALRFSDIRSLTFADIHKTETGYQIEKIQEKTKESVTIPLSSTALKTIGEIPTDAKNLEKRVFDIPCNANTNLHLQQWAKDSGIKKRVTFHTARHTAATMLLTYGADIYTTSKILGHTNVRTTQIYAEVVNQKKVDAVAALPEL